MSVASGGSVIQFDPSLVGATITLDAFPDITVEGPANDGITLTSASGRIFRLRQGGVLRNLTLSGASDGPGSAVCAQGPLRLEHTTVSNNNGDGAGNRALSSGVKRCYTPSAPSRMCSMALSFEWDPRKAAANLRKHGVSFEEARTTFADPLGRIVGDPRHSVDEEREVLIGTSERGRLVAVMFTERTDTIRVISARLVTRRERIDYEEGHE